MRAVVLAVLLLLVAIAGMFWVRLWPHQVAAVADLVESAEQSLGPAGWLMAMGLQVVIALCGILPASVGAVTAGMVFGTVGGVLIAGPATLAGAAIGFLLSRSLLRGVVTRLLLRRPAMLRLDEAIARDGWRLVCLMRVSPIMPFAMTSYALGLTSISLRAYILGTLASLPALFLYVLLGDLTGAGLASLSSSGAGPLRWGLFALAIGATALLTLRVGAILRSVLRLPEETSRRE